MDVGFGLICYVGCCLLFLYCLLFAVGCFRLLLLVLIGCACLFGCSFLFWIYVVLWLVVACKFCLWFCFVCFFAVVLIVFLWLFTCVGVLRFCWFGCS